MARKKDYSKLSKNELIQLVEKLERKKKYGLVWDAERVPGDVVEYDAGQPGISLDVEIGVMRTP